MSFVVTLITLLLTAASARAEGLILWHSYRGSEAQTLEEFAQLLDSSVKVVAIPADKLSDKVSNAIAIDDAPDVIISAHEKIVEWRHGLAPVYFGDEPDLRVAIDAVSRDGVHYGHPFAVKSVALLHRAGRRPATLNALARPADGFPLGFDLREFYFVAPFALPLTPLVQEESLVLAPAMPAFAWLRQASHDRFIPRGMNHAQLMADFEAGRIEALITGPWALGELSARTLATVEVSPLPPVELASRHTMTPRPFLTVDAIFVTKRAPEAAHQLARALASRTFAKVRATRAQQIPPFTDGIVENPLLLAFAEQARTAIPMPSGRAMSAAWLPLQHLVEGVVNTTEDLATLIAATEAEHRAFLVPVVSRGGMLVVVLAFAGVAGLIVAALRSSKRAKASRHLQHQPLAGLIAPATIFGVLFVVLPLLVGLLLCFFDFSEEGAGAYSAMGFRFVGLGNFVSILSGTRFWWTLFVTVLWTVCNLLLSVGLGVVVALLLASPSLPLRGWFRVLLVLPWAVPNYISALAFRGLFDVERGAVNQMLVWLGAAPVDWYARFFTSFCTNLITNVWLGFPFMMVVTLGALQTIPQEQREAMLLDGATAWQRFVHLTVPSIAPVMAPAVLLSTAWTFNMFNVVYLVSGGSPRGETDILVSEAYRWAFERGHRYGLAAAYCVLIALILSLFMAWMKRSKESV